MKQIYQYYEIGLPTRITINIWEVRFRRLNMDGILRCSRYAFGPNRLHYCGPDANREILAYIQEGAVDPGLEILLKDFKTMYPYLRFIADANKIKDPFDNRVVEAYWLGNELLETVDAKKFYQSLLKDHEAKKQISPKDFKYIVDKLSQKAVLNHSFHILNIWKSGTERSLGNMDACRISSGVVKNIDGPFITVETEPLLYSEGKFFLGEATQKRIMRRLGAIFDIEQLKAGEIISIHWNVPCEVITTRQAAILKKYTLKNIELANQTV